MAVAATAAFAVTAAAGGYWYASRAEDSIQGSTPSEAAATSDVQADPPAAPDSRGRNDAWTLGQVSAPDVPAPRAQGTATRAADRERVPAPVPASRASPPPVATAAPVAPSTGAVRAPRPSPPEPVPPRPEPVTPSVAIRRPVDPVIYSAADSDVEAPTALSLQPLLPPAAPNADLRRASTFELVIDEDGNVESARLVGRPQTLVDGSPLSYLKNQKFRPATKDGVPVRYKLLLQ
jgi:hypothetical protein